MDTPSDHDEAKLLGRTSIDADSLGSSEIDRHHAVIRHQDLAKRRRLHIIRIVLDIIVAACLGVVIFLLVRIQAQTSSCELTSDAYSVMHRPPAGSDLSGVVPLGEVGGRTVYKSWDESGPLAVKRKDFHETEALNRTLQAWEDIMKPFVKADESWDHRGPEIPLTHELFEVSAFHQIHCLSGILEDFSYMAMGIPQTDLPSVTRLEHLDWGEHNAHCFNYVMNAIMCFADTTTEGATPGDPPVVHKEATHVCNDWNALYEWSDRPEHRMPEIDGLRAVN